MLNDSMHEARNIIVKRTYISLSVVIFPISFGMLPVKLFHIKSL